VQEQRGVAQVSDLEAQFYIFDLERIVLQNYKISSVNFFQKFDTFSFLADNF